MKKNILFVVLALGISLGSVSAQTEYADYFGIGWAWGLGEDRAPQGFMATYQIGAVIHPINLGLFFDFTPTFDLFADNTTTHSNMSLGLQGDYYFNNFLGLTAGGGAAIKSFEEISFTPYIRGGLLLHAFRGPKMTVNFDYCFDRGASVELMIYMMGGSFGSRLRNQKAVQASLKKRGEGKKTSQAPDPSLTASISLGVPFEDSFTAKRGMHVYRMDVPQGVSAVDFYATGTPARMAALTSAGLEAVIAGKQPPQSEILGANYTDFSTDFQRGNAAVPPNRQIYFWVTEVGGKKGAYTITTKGNLPPPAPFNGVWAFSQSSQLKLRFEGNNWFAIFNDGTTDTVMGGGTFTHTGDSMTLVTTQRENPNTGKMEAVPPDSQVRLFKIAADKLYVTLDIPFPSSNNPQGVATIDGETYGFVKSE